MLRIARRVYVLASLAVWLVSAAGCTTDGDSVSRIIGQLDYGGRVERIESLGRESWLDSAFLLQLAGDTASVETDDDLYMYRIVYRTAGVQPGTKATVSGLVAIPATRNIKGVVSWQHGTNTDRSNSISKPSLPEGLGLSALFAADGYVLAAADYIGLGVSTEPQAYYHWPSTVQTVVDLCAIVEIMLDGIAMAPERNLYLAGFSQGGAATAATQRYLQENNPTRFTLRAAATISGAFNPRQISLRNFIERDDPFFIAMTLYSLSVVHGESLDGVVREPYRSRLANLFDGTHGQTAIMDQLPKHLSELVTDQFMQAFQAGGEFPQWFYDGLRDAETDDYAPVAPLRIYYGTNDTVVVPLEATEAFAHMRELEGNVELVNAGPYGHDEMVVRSLPSIQQWFDQRAGGH